MSYDQQIKSAADWLAAIQNADKGWGRTQGLASSIVNTAEAIHVLKRADPDAYAEQIQSGQQFIQDKALKAVQAVPRTRYCFFALSAIALDRSAFAAEFVSEMTDWLLMARNRDGAWGHVANDQASCLYPTVMSLIVLTDLGHRDELATGMNWLVSRKSPYGWAFESKSAANPVATCMAVVALRRFKAPDDPVFEKLNADLLTLSSWNTAKEDMPGADWVHSAHMWYFWALLSLGNEPYVRPIADGIRDMNRLMCKQGWREPDGHLTVRGQYWAVFGINLLRDGFDPTIHVYRIDSARAMGALLEPEFVHIRPGTRWTIVMPRRVYQGITHILIGLSVFFFLGIHRAISEALPSRSVQWLDFGVAVALFLGGYYLMRKRSKYFSRRFRAIILGLIGALAFLDLVFGVSVNQLSEALQKFRSGKI